MNETGLRRIAAGLRIKIVAINGPWLQASCPFARWKHPKGTDRHPSFGLLVNAEGESYYKCFTCKSTGRISSLVRALENLRDEDYPGLALEADRMDYDVVVPTYEELMARQHETIVLEALDENAYGDLFPSVLDYPEGLEYLEGRGISEDTAELLSLRFDPDEERVVFPVRDRNGGLFGYSGRTIRPANAISKKYPKVRDYAGLPKEYMLLGAEAIDPDKPILVVEGLMGYAHLVEIGARDILNPVAMLGSELTQHKADLLVEWGQPVYMMPDNDDAGDTCLFGPFRDDNSGERKQNGAISKLRGEVPLFVPDWPEDKDDPDQLTIEDLEYILNHAPAV